MWQKVLNRKSLINYKMKNQPYVKKFENGVLVNPISKENPVIQYSSNKGGKKFRKSNNKKGVSLMVRRIGVLTFEKLYTVKQYVDGKCINHLVANI